MSEAKHYPSVLNRIAEKNRELSRLHDINRELLEALSGLVAQYKKLSAPDDPISAITERYWGALYRNAEAAIRKAIMTEQKPRHICKPSCHNPCLLDEEPKPVGEPVDDVKHIRELCHLRDINRELCEEFCN